MSESVKSIPIWEYDISTINTQIDFNIFSGKNPNSVSIQLDWEGLTGTLDASLQIIQRNDERLKWVNVTGLSHIMDVASDSIMLENTEWGGENMGLRLIKNGCTGGKISIVVIAKNK